MVIVEEKDADAKSTASGQSAGSAYRVSTSAEVNKHLEKLDLVKIVAGQKKGVQLNWAEKALPKLTMKFQLELQSHMRLCRLATKLQPDSIAGQSTDEIYSGYRGLE